MCADLSVPGVDAHADTGIAGLDDVLAGGLTPNRLYLIEGAPGAGKTTLALQFLMAGVHRGEPVLYITLSETEEELQAVADSHGWDIDGIAVHEIIPSEDSLQPEEQYTMFHPSEVELSEASRSILEKVDQVRPTRVVFDSLSEMRLLAGNPLRFRRQVLALKQFFAGRRCTVLLLDDQTGVDQDLHVQSIVHGVLLLEQLQREYGAERRRLRVMKFRGRQFRGGFHDYVIQRGGLEVYPRLVAAEHRALAGHARMLSGVPELDELLGGGIDVGSSTMLSGATGTGKSTLAAQFVAAAASRKQPGAMFLFDESPDMLLHRVAALGIDLKAGVESGMVTLQQVDPAELSPGELVHQIRTAVDTRGACIIVIDSLNGYLSAMPRERFLTSQLHELLAFLSQRGVATILVSAHQGIIGSGRSRVDASYLSDTIIMLRYFESRGSIRQAISVIKKRGSAHERTIREFELDHGRIRVGQPLREFRGVLTGVPVFKGNDAALISRDRQ